MLAAWAVIKATGYFICLHDAEVEVEDAVEMKWKSFIEREK